MWHWIKANKKLLFTIIETIGSSAGLTFALINLTGELKHKKKKES